MFFKICAFNLLIICVLVDLEYAQNTCNGRDECIPIKQCTPLLDFIKSFKNGVPQRIQQGLREINCGFSGKQPMVCCSPLTGRGDPMPPNVSRHRNYNLLPTNCGYIEDANKIVKGNKTGLFEFPWMALIQHQTPNGPSFGCGGTIINEKYILTAAHCISEPLLREKRRTVLSVRVGDHDTSTQRDCEVIKGKNVCAPPYEDLRIEELIPHAGYNHKLSIDNDIGLIRVRGNIKLRQENMRPVCLPVGPGRLYQFNGNKGVVTGWGATETSFASKDLLRANLPVTSWQDCTKIYKQISSPVTYKHFCAGGTGPDSCNGDSGGPFFAVVGDENTGDVKYMQHGIVSLGPINCGAIGYPGIYTKVPYFMDWILDNMRR